MRAAQAVAIFVALILLLTWLSLRAADPKAELFDRALVELDHFVTIENALYRDVFTARAGTLRNYDPLVKEINALRDSLDRLRATSAIDAETNAAIDRLAASIDRQEELIESFKSNNALLQNSLAFFGRFRLGSDSPDLDRSITAASAAILHLALDTSSGSVREVQNRIDELDVQASRMGLAGSVDTLLAHGRLLQGLLPSVDGTLKAMRALPQTQQQDALRGLIVKHQVASRREARWYRGLLYATSLILVAFLVHLGIRLRSRAHALQRRVAFEHVIAGISMRFINARPQDIDAEIDRAVADLAACVGSDRAYFVMSGPAPRLHLWHRPGLPPPPGWPAEAVELAIRMGTCSVAHIPRVSRMPIGDSKARFLELGLGGWCCATNVGKDGAQVALGFDAVGRAACRIKTRGEHALVRMALDTILQAVERRTIENERARLETRLRQARRLEKIGTFTSGISHNFNNILGGILGHSEVMEEHGGSDTRFAHNLAAIRRGAERARDLVDQLLAFGRRRDARRKPLSVGALIAETATLLGVSLPRGIDLVIRQPPVATIVSGDDAPLQQVILNLCNNAAHAMQDGGRIEIATELHEVPEPLALSHDEIRPGHYVCITVTDTGHGMDEATLGRIFEPFFTTRPSGNGLGLATVREIIHEHGGTVSVQSKPNEGSRFEVWLPRATAAPMSAPDDAAFPSGKGETVMIVAHDVERILRDEEMLAALGYEPVGFTNADAALAACRADADRFDMTVIGNLGLAARALELAAALHATAPRLPIVLASKAAIEIGADALVAAGISDVVRWPIVAEEIAMAFAHSSALTQIEGRPQRRPTLARPDAESLTL
jgi:signal transduction histidine kinase/FixJ family two-component response regulator